MSETTIQRIRERLAANRAAALAAKHPVVAEPTKAELVAKAEELGVPKYGTKAEIAERVAEAEAPVVELEP